MRRSALRTRARTRVLAVGSKTIYFLVGACDCEHGLTQITATVVDRSNTPEPRCSQRKTNRKWARAGPTKIQNYFLAWHVPDHEHSSSSIIDQKSTTRRDNNAPNRTMLKSRMARRKCFFAVSIAISVFLVVYSEYLSRNAAQRDNAQGNHGVLLQALSEFRPQKTPQVLQFQNNNHTVSLVRRSRRENLLRDAFRSPSSNHGKEQGQHVSRSRHDYRLPPLNTMLNSKREIVGNVQMLLHYAIIGFGKCGTTSMMQLLQSHSQLQSLDSEVWALIEKNPARLVERLHKKLTRNKMRGYKCPGDILASYALEYYRQYWPQTKLIVGVRHPVLHFQSLYNFRVQNFEDYASILDPIELIGPCQKHMKMVCTKRSHFGYYLMQLGKHLLPGVNHNNQSATTTPHKFTALEKRIATFYPHQRLTRHRMKPLPNDIFLFDVHQLGDVNATRRELFRRDLAQFLGVSPDGYRDNMTADLNHYTPGREWNPSVQSLKDKYKINVCDPQHIQVRIELMNQARDSSLWIRETFVNSPGVHVSSREHLEQLLATWMIDPCGGNETTTMTDNVTLSTTTGSSASIVKDAKTAFEQPDYALPPLESILNETGHIVGDPQILLQFAIIGFGKSGTTTLMMWLREHPQLQSLQEEIWALPMQQPDRLLSRLHRKLTRNLQRGYKCPGDVINTYSHNFYRQYLPKTKLFIGVRHPVRWFESLYNFRLQNFEDHSGMPDPNDVIGLCVKSRKLICTYRGNFAHHLMKLGKHIGATTRPYSPLEQEIANWYPKYSYEPHDIQPLPNEIFLFELSQLGDKDDSRKRQLRSDIQDFLGLTQDLPEAIHYTPGKKWDEKTQAEKDRLKIRICDDQYLPIRTELMQQARYSSQWIRQVFLDSPGVHVSSRPYFEELVEQWMTDPCNNKTDTTELPSQTRVRLRLANKERRKEEEERNEQIS